MKRRNFRERAAIVASYIESGQTQEAFAKANDISLGSLVRWIRENRRDGGGYVEVDTNSFSDFGSVACRVVAGNLTFEFGALPGPQWLAEFAAACSMRATRTK